MQLFTVSWSRCRQIVNETLSKWGQLDVLVNNASFQGKAVEKFEEITRERMEFTFHSNILNYFSTCQAAAKHMKKGSTIINITSIQGYNPSPAVLDYSTTKVDPILIAGLLKRVDKSFTKLACNALSCLLEFKCRLNTLFMCRTAHTSDPACVLVQTEQHQLSLMLLSSC